MLGTNLSITNFADAANHMIVSILQKAGEEILSIASSETNHTAPPWVGSRSPDGWDQIPRWAGGWVLHQPPWSFGFDSQTRGTRENRRTLC